LVKKDINAYLLSNFSNDDVTVVACEGDSDEPVIIVSAYLAHDEEAPPVDLVRIANEAAERGWRMVIGADANAHHTVWGSTDINDRGESFLEFILRSRISIANRGEEPTYKGPTSENVLDITLFTDHNTVVEDWKVLNQPSFSDHRYIHFKFLLNIARKKLSFRNPRRTDWGKFEAFLGKKLSKPCRISSIEDIETSLSYLTTHLNTAYKRSCPLTRPKSRPRPPWWNRELESLRKEVKEIFKLAKTADCKECWGEYRDLCKAYKTKIKKAKKDSWESFCSGIENTLETARLRKVLANNPVAPGLIKTTNGEWTNNAMESLSTLMEVHFPGNEDPSTISNKQSQRRRIPPGLLTKQRLDWAIDSFDPYKSPGLDMVFPAMIQKAKTVLSHWLMAIYRGCLELNYVPESWRAAKVVFIPKVGKSSHCGPKDYRPISLTSFLLKILERVIEIWIRENLTPGFLSDDQHAYTRGKSTESALHSVVGTIERALEYKNFAMGSFLDIEGAFNNVTAEAIIEELHLAGVEPIIALWIEKLLRQRLIVAEWGGSVLTRVACRGTPQGGVLSPLLWSLVMNRLLLNLHAQGFRATAYADDLVIVISGSCIHAVRDLTKTALDNVRSWTEQVGLSVNPQKTELVLFTRKYKIPTFEPIRLGDATLEIKTKAKYLGIILDSKLSWKENIEERVKKASCALYACKRMLGKTWGLSPTLVHWIYTAIVKPVLTYGAVVWWTSMDKITLVRKMERVQRLAALSITGALKTTPTKALETILHLPPIDLEVAYAAKMAALRLTTSGKWVGRVYGHSRTGLEFTEDIDHVVPQSNLQRRFKAIIGDGVIETDDLSALSLYTDGSKMCTGVGAAFFSQELAAERCFRLPDKCSIFQAEIFAVKEAAKFANQEETVNRRVNIHIDSQAAIKALICGDIRSKLVLECRDALNNLSVNRKVRLIWVRGHIGVAGNERADALAKKGALLPTDSITSIPVPMVAVKNNIREKLFRTAERRWNDTGTCKTARAIWPSLNKSNTKYVLKLSRADCRAIVGVITGHCLIGAHAYKLNLATSEICRKCLEPGAIETVEHILCHCPGFAKLRYQLFGEPWLFNLECMTEHNLSTILSFAKSTRMFRDY